MAQSTLKVSLKCRISQSAAHYAGNLASGAKVLELFGDAATEILIRHDGDEGLFCAYENVEFLAPVYAGDFLEITAELVHVGNTSRKIKFAAHKIITTSHDAKRPSAAKTLQSPLLVAEAMGICVVKK